MIELSDQDILSRLTNTEDSTGERKTANDYRDCLKTAVAFSNSLPVDDPGIIFVGVGNDGTVQDNPNLDSLQRKVSEEINKAYPPIYPQMKVMANKDGKELLTVIVRGSPQRPHFAGPSYIRDGMQSREASEQQFERLIAERNAKAYAIIKWIGKTITVDFTRATATGPMPGTSEDLLSGCNQFYLTLEGGGSKYCVPLTRVEVSFDPAKERLKLEVHPL